MADNNKFKPVYPYTIDVNAQNVQYIKALMHGELPEQKKQQKQQVSLLERIYKASGNNQKQNEIDQKTGKLAALEPSYYCAVSMIRPEYRGNIQLIDDNVLFNFQVMYNGMFVNNFSFGQKCECYKVIYDYLSLIYEKNKLNETLMPQPEKQEPPKVNLEYAPLNNLDSAVLYDMTNGDLDSFITLAIMKFYSCNPFIKIKPLAVLANTEFVQYYSNEHGKEWTRRLFENTSLNKADLLNLYVYSFFEKEPFTSLFGKIANVNQGEAYNQKKLFTGSGIGIKHPDYDFYVNIVNHKNIVYFTDNQEDYNKFIKRFNAIGVVLNTKGSALSGDSQWFKVTFLNLGEKLYENKGQSPFKSLDGSKKQISGHDKIIDSFLNDLCIIDGDKNHKIKTKDLHEAYVKYVQKHYKTSPFKPKAFTTFIKENYKEIEYKRARFKDESSAPYAFLGIRINEEKYDKLIASSSEDSQSEGKLSLEDFTLTINNYIDHLNKLKNRKPPKSKGDKDSADEK